MSSAPVAALIVLLTLAVVLLVSGVAKARDSRATRDAFQALRVPGPARADVAAAALPWVEIALAVLLLATPTGWLVPVTLAVLMLMLAYTGLVARALGFDEPVSCSCFGSLGRHEIDRTTLGRNLLLAALAGAGVWFALDGGSAPAVLGDLDAAGWWALAAAAAAAAAAVLVVGVPSPPSSAAGSDLLDYERQPIPYGVLTLPDGRSATLAELATTQARLLVVLKNGCGPCDRIALRLDEWVAQLDPVVGVLALYSYKPPGDADLFHSPDLMVLEPELNVSRLLSRGTPSAVLLGADGYLAGGPVAGEDNVAGFVEDVLAELSASRVADGAGMPSGPE